MRLAAGEREPTRSRGGRSDGRGRRATVSRPPLPEPLPAPVVDNHCHLDIAGRRQLARHRPRPWSWRPSVGVPRIVQIGCDLPGARLGGRDRDGVRRDRGRGGDPPERGAAARRCRCASTTALAEIERLATSSPRVRAVGETGLDYYRTGPDGVAAQQPVVRGRTSRWPGASTRRSSSTTATRTTTCWRCSTSTGCRSGRCCTASPATPTSPGPASTAVRYLSFAGTVTFKNAAEPARRPGGRAARPDPGRDRRAVPDADAATAAGRTRPTSSRRRCGRWRRSAAVDLEQLCAAIDANTDAAFGGSWGPGVTRAAYVPARRHIGGYGGSSRRVSAGERHAVMPVTRPRLRAPVALHTAPASGMVVNLLAGSRHALQTPMMAQIGLAERRWRASPCEPGRTTFWSIVS